MSSFPGFSLKGKICCVTGGSRGLGKEISLGFAESGAAAIVIASRKIEACDEVRAEIKRRYPKCETLSVACNVSIWDDCNVLFNKTIETFGKCDVLVNNAGSSPLYPSLVDVSEKLFDKTIALNLKGPFRLCALFGAKMCTQHNGGSIINVSTTGTLHPGADATVYGAAKSGVNYLTRAIANAYGPKVRCNCIMPGSFFTDISKSWDKEKLGSIWKRTTALQRAGNPHEVVGAAIYFASDASTYTTGSILEISGSQQAGAVSRDPRYKGTSALSKL